MRDPVFAAFRSSAVFSSLLRLLAAMTRAERLVLATLAIILLGSFGMLLRLFYVQNTMEVPVVGGTYIEGSVGSLQPLNPWFVIGNDVNRDLVSLIFSGLLRYDPKRASVVEDLATMKVTDDSKVYTLTLKPNLVWHDSTDARPHLVTADDVLFTFKTIQDPLFPNPILHENFRGVAIEKLGERTVRFTLQKPYAFFPSNLTLGLLPKSAFEGVPVSKLTQALDFGFHPIGCGPYQFANLLQTDISTEVTLKQFPQKGLAPYNIDRIVLRVFPDYTTLLSDITNVNGVRLVPRNEQGRPILPNRFKVLTYVLPQYVGVFFNLDRPVLADRLLRLGLELATNKQQIADALHETQIVDTPLAELDLGDWHYAFDPRAAQGALFESNWHMPEKLKLQRLLEERETNTVGPLKTIDRIAFLETGATLTLTGSLQGLKLPLTVNGTAIETGATLEAVTNRTLSGSSWSVRLQAGSGGLRIGKNLLRLTDGKGRVIDSAYIERVADFGSFQRARQEEQLVDLFLRSKRALPSAPHITVDDLYTDNGYLRRKTPADPPHTRIDARGRPLKLTILTSPSPVEYGQAAAIIQRQWEAVGVAAQLDVPQSRREFEDRLLKRDYDVVLFGESLLDNPDSYPYWHSSQVQERSDAAKRRVDAFNLSQYTSFEADTLLTRIRETGSTASRERALKQLSEIFKRDVPAVFLYSPLYTYAYEGSVQGVAIGRLALHSDRFLSLSDWYITTERRFLPGRGWASFVPWLFALFV